MALSVIGLVLGFALLIGGSWKRISMFLIAVIASGVIGLTSGLGFFSALEGPYLEGFTSFLKGWALVFACGALLAKIYEFSGAGQKIGNTIVDSCGIKMTIPVFVLVGAIFSFCGISAPVAVLVLLPIAKVIFPKARIPWFMFPTIVGFASITFAMCAPGSLGLTNIIAASAMNVTNTAAPVAGLVAVVFIVVVGLAYIFWETKRAQAAGNIDLPSDYLPAVSTGSEDDLTDNSPNFIVCIIPLIVTVVLVDVIKISLIASFMAGCLLALVLFWKYIPDKVAVLSGGFNDGIMPAFLVASVIGFGSVISATPVFEVMKVAILDLPGNGLTKVALSTTLLSGVSASGTGGIQLAMNLFGEEFLSWGISPALIARVASIACLGLDSLPWNGSIVMFFVASGLSYNKGYKGLFVTTVLLPIVTSLLIALIFG